MFHVADPVHPRPLDLQPVAREPAHRGGEHGRGSGGQLDGVVRRDQSQSATKGRVVLRQEPSLVAVRDRHRVCLEQGFQPFVDPGDDGGQPQAAGRARRGRGRVPPRDAVGRAPQQQEAVAGHGPIVDLQARCQLQARARTPHAQHRHRSRRAHDHGAALPVGLHERQTSLRGLAQQVPHTAGLHRLEPQHVLPVVAVAVVGAPGIGGQEPQLLQQPQLPLRACVPQLPLLPAQVAPGDAASDPGGRSPREHRSHRDPRRWGRLAAGSAAADLELQRELSTCRRVRRRRRPAHRREQRSFPWRRAGRGDGGRCGRGSLWQGTLHGHEQDRGRVIARAGTPAGAGAPDGSELSVRVRWLDPQHRRVARCRRPHLAQQLARAQRAAHGRDGLALDQGPTSEEYLCAHESADTLLGLADRQDRHAAPLHPRRLRWAR